MKKNAGHVLNCSPCAVQEFNLAFRRITSCNDLIVVVLRVRAICSWGKGDGVVVDGVNISAYLQHRLARWGWRTGYPGDK